jgi:hypothetical protein
MRIGSKERPDEDPRNDVNENQREQNFPSLIATTDNSPHHKPAEKPDRQTDGYAEAQSQKGCPSKQPRLSRKGRAHNANKRYQLEQRCQAELCTLSGAHFGSRDLQL